MTASTVGRNTVQYDVKPTPDYVVVPVAASTVIYQGTMVAIDSTGYARMAENTTGAQKIIGRADGPGDVGLNGDVDNSSGAAGALTVRVRQGVFGPWANGDSIAVTDIGKPAYASDDHTIYKTDGQGQYNFAGIIYNKDSNGVYVQMSLAIAMSGGGSASVPENLGPAVQALFNCRMVITVALAAYTKTAGVILADANGAIGSVFDGVTAAVNDIVFFPEGIAAAAADAGPWQITALGGASAKFELKRPSWYASGSLIQPGLIITVQGNGSVFEGSDWKSFVTTALKVVDTDAPLFWPRNMRKTVTLSAGTLAVGSTSFLMLRSTTKSSVHVTQNTAGTAGGAPTLTTEYQVPVATRTAGVIGTGALTINATVAAGTLNNADTSTLDLTVINW